MTEIRRVGVLGCGLMGSGIAQVAATAGHETIVRDVSQQIWERARGGIEKSLAKFVEKGKLPAADRDAALKRLTFTTATGDLKGCDIDRKSTRLNSSHSQISYAVFCLKKKKKQ